MHLFSFRRALVSVCYIWWTMVHKYQILLVWTRGAGLAWPKNKIETKGSLHVCFWVLHILHICIALLGNKAVRLWGVYVPSYCNCLSHNAILHIQICSSWFCCSSYSWCKWCIYGNRKDVEVQWLWVACGNLIYSICCLMGCTSTHLLPFLGHLEYELWSCINTR